MQERERARGVTPGLSRDYATRSATRQAAFVLPLLRPGLRLLDVGCGPGTITVGLAGHVAPGYTVGIDYDPLHVKSANALAQGQGIANMGFRIANALHLPFPAETFDVVFENDMLTHVADRAPEACHEVYRVLKPGGFFAARDVDASAAIWGPPSAHLKQLDELMVAWQTSRGSDAIFGQRLPAVLHQAGFSDVTKSVCADTKGDPKSVRAHAGITISLLDGPWGEAILAHGWATPSTIERLKARILSWAEHPDAFFANIHIEVIGWKPA